MSGPVSLIDASSVAEAGHAEAPCVEVTRDREATVGRFAVRRALPRRERRTVGAWCFADHIGPAPVTERSGLDIGPHPHTGLQTVTWLVDGEALHRDSLGSEQVIRPGQLNLMTAGRGVAHSEEATGSYRGVLHGIQLWVAQPDRTRLGTAGFEHHAELPCVELGHVVATVLLGGFGGARSPARHDTPLVGVDLVVQAGRSHLPLRPEFEYAVIVLDGALTVHDQSITPGRLGYLGLGRDAVTFSADTSARALLFGGEPFEEPILMWWNFVARSREEIDAAHRAWESAEPRFGQVSSSLPRAPGVPPPWTARARAPDRSG